MKLIAAVFFIASMTVKIWLPSLNEYLEVPKADRPMELAWRVVTAWTACAFFLLAWVVREAEERAMKKAKKEE